MRIFFIKLIKWSEFYFSSILVYTWLKFDRIEYSIQLSNIRSNRTYKKFDLIRSDRSPNDGRSRKSSGSRENRILPTLWRNWSLRTPSSAWSIRIPYNWTWRSGLNANKGTYGAEVDDGRGITWTYGMVGERGTSLITLPLTLYYHRLFAILAFVTWSRTSASALNVIWR
jgi:hypothetical protein